MREHVFHPRQLIGWGQITHETCADEDAFIWVVLMKLVEKRLERRLHAGIGVITLADRIIGGAVDVLPEKVAIVMQVVQKDCISIGTM